MIRSHSYRNCRWFCIECLRSWRVRWESNWWSPTAISQSLNYCSYRTDRRFPHRLFDRSSIRWCGNAWKLAQRSVSECSWAIYRQDFCSIGRASFCHQSSICRSGRGCREYRWLSTGGLKTACVRCFKRLRSRFWWVLGAADPIPPWVSWLSGWSGWRRWLSW